MFSFSVKNVDMQDAKRGYHADIHFPWNVDDLVWNICPQNKKSKISTTFWMVYNFSASKNDYNFELDAR
jgi:hypothetical protein